MSSTAIVARRRADGGLDLHHSAHGAARLFFRELFVAHAAGEIADPVGADGRDLPLAAVLDDARLPAARAAAHADEPLVAAEPTARVDSRRALGVHTNYLLYDAVYVVDEVRDPSEGVEPYLPLWCFLDPVRAFRESLSCRVTDADGGSVTLDDRRVTARVLAGEDGLRRLLGQVHRPVLREQYRALTDLARGDAAASAPQDLAPTVAVGEYDCELSLRSATPSFPNPVGQGVYLPLSGVGPGEFEDLHALVDQTRVDENVAVATDQIAAMEGEPLPEEPFEMTSGDVVDRFLDRLGSRAVEAGASVPLGADAVADFSPSPTARVSTPIEREEPPGA